MTEKRQEAREETAMDRFRRSVGFQFGFVLYSGLDVKTAIEHICSSAEKHLLPQPTGERCGECGHHWSNQGCRVCASVGKVCKCVFPATEAPGDYAMEMAVGKRWLNYKDAAERIVARIADNDCLTCKHWSSDAVYAIAVELAIATTGAGEGTERDVLVRREDAARCAELVNDSFKAKGKFAAAILMMPPYPARDCPICAYPIDNEGLCVLDAAHTAPATVVEGETQK